MVWQFRPEPKDGDWNGLTLKLRELEQCLRYINNFQTFTPVWSGTLGNGTIEGWFMETQDRRDVSVRLVWGSTTSHPASAQSIRMPADLDRQSVGYWNGAALALDATSTEDPGVAVIADTQQVWFFVSTVTWTNVLPFTWTTGDELRFSCTYRIALDP